MFIVQPPIHAGDRPGKGTWRCRACNWRVTITEHHDPLPECGGECKKSADVDESDATYTRVRGIPG